MEKAMENKSIDKANVESNIHEVALMAAEAWTKSRSNVSPGGYGQDVADVYLATSKALTAALRCETAS